MTYEEKSNELIKLHQKLKFENGSLNDEFSEQVMSMMFLTGDEKVLELGGHVGRNSVIIGYILNQKNNHNFVCLETITDNAEKLMHNRDINGLIFHVENAALSSRKLIQQGHDSIPCDEILPGYISVNTITWKELNNKYKIDFDTLVLDCEGAFYYILLDTPEILHNIKLVIMENDYFKDWTHLDYVWSELKKHNFECVFSKDLPFQITNFYQVWKKL